MTGTLVSGGNVRSFNKTRGHLLGTRVPLSWRFVGTALCLYSLPVAALIFGINALPHGQHITMHASSTMLQVSALDPETVKGMAMSPMLIMIGVTLSVLFTPFLGRRTIGRLPKKLLRIILALIPVMLVCTIIYGGVTTLPNPTVNAAIPVNTWGSTHLHLTDIYGNRPTTVGVTQIYTLPNEHGKTVTYTVTRDADTTGHINYTYRVGK